MYVKEWEIRKCWKDIMQTHAWKDYKYSKEKDVFNYGMFKYKVSKNYVRICKYVFYKLVSDLSKNKK